MTTKKKILTALALVVCAVLLVVGSVAGTLAYLQDSKTVTNTFTVGNVSITMDELAVDVYGEEDTTADPARRSQNTYKLIPGHTYIKDPTIHLAAGSEACYLFVKVENGIAGAEAATNTIADQLTTHKWKALQGAANVYVYTDATSVATDKSIIASSDATQDFPVIGTITVSNTADLSSYSGRTVVVTAYAVQADGFADAAAAWTATFGATTGNS